MYLIIGSWFPKWIPCMGEVKGEIKDGGWRRWQVAGPCAHPSPGGGRHHGAHRHGARPPLRRRQPYGHQLTQRERGFVGSETEPGKLHSLKRPKKFYDRIYDLNLPSQLLLNICCSNVVSAVLVKAISIVHHGFGIMITTLFITLFYVILGLKFFF